MKLSIIIVSYNASDLLRKCIQSIVKNIGAVKHEIIIVDNNSTDEMTIKFLDHLEERENCKVIKYKENLGFARANNVGIKVSSGNFIVLLNQDTEILNNAFEIMVDFMKAKREVGICGPGLFNPDGSVQVSFYSFPAVGKKLLQLIGINKIIIKYPLILQKLYKIGHFLPRSGYWFVENFRPREHPMEVPWVTAACLMTRREVFESIGLLDENYRMYSEDTDLCLRASKHNWQTWYIPQAEVLHYRGWGKRDKSKRIIELYYKSHQYFYQKHFKGLSQKLMLLMNRIQWILEETMARGTKTMDRK